MFGDRVGCALLREGFAHRAALHNWAGRTGLLHVCCSFAPGDEERPLGVRLLVFRWVAPQPSCCLCRFWGCFLLQGALHPSVLPISRMPSSA